MIDKFAKSILDEELAPRFDTETGALLLAEAAAPMTYARALDVVRGLSQRKLPRPSFAPHIPPVTDLHDLNIADFHGRSHVKHAVDITVGHRGTLSEVQIMNCAMDGKMEDLPAILLPPLGATQVNHFVQTAVIKRGDAHDIVRWITFQTDAPQGKARPEVANSHKHGELHLLNYAANQRNGKKGFAYLFERLGGYQVRMWEFHGGAGNAEAGDEDLDNIDAGFDFIDKAHRERKIGSNGFQHLRWVTKQVKDANGPLYKWREGLIKEAIRQLKEEGALAKTVLNCPYTLNTFQPWFIDRVLADLVPHMKVRSLGLIGRSGCGKTPVMEGIANMFSRYWKRIRGLDVPTSYRTSVDLGFFSGEVGTIDRPDALDDADPRMIPPARFKAFTDVGLVEAMTRERWGASKWVRDQLREFAVNPVKKGPAVEPSEGDTVTHEEVMELLELIWHKDFDEESQIAILKRACLIVITDDWCY